MDREDAFSTALLQPRPGEPVYERRARTGKPRTRPSGVIAEVVCRVGPASWFVYVDTGDGFPVQMIGPGEWLSVTESIDEVNRASGERAARIEARKEASRGFKLAA